jgi:transcriptional regulator with XRE-family HTH domain
MTTKHRVNEGLVKWRLADLKRQGLRPGTQAQLASTLGVSDSFLNQQIKGNRGIDIVEIKRMAFALSIPPELLLVTESEAAA